MTDELDNWYNDWNVEPMPSRQKEKLQALIDRECNKAREIFIPVKGYEGLYEVSNTGKVCSIARGRNTGVELRQSVRVRKYLCVQLSKENARKSYNVHRLVAEAFISNPLNKRTVNHKDGNPANNDVENLEWATHSENERHARANGKVMWNKGRMGVRANVPRIAELSNKENK